MQQDESQGFVGEREAWDHGSQLSGQRHPSPTTGSSAAERGMPPEGHTRTKPSRGYRILGLLRTRRVAHVCLYNMSWQGTWHAAPIAGCRSACLDFGSALVSDDGGSADRGRLAAGSRPCIGFCGGLLQGGFLFRWDVVLLAFRLMHPCILLPAQHWLSLLVAAEVLCCWPGMLTCKMNTSELVGHHVTANTSHACTYRVLCKASPGFTPLICSRIRDSDTPRVIRAVGQLVRRRLAQNPCLLTSRFNHFCPRTAIGGCPADWLCHGQVAVRAIPRDRQIVLEWQHLP